MEVVEPGPDKDVIQGPMISNEGLATNVSQSLHRSSDCVTRLVITDQGRD